MATVAGLNGGTVVGTFAFEVAKTGMQLIAVAGAGSVATIAVQTYLTSLRLAEEDRRKAVEATESNRREVSEQAEKQQRLREEQWQREADRAIDARLRRDELLRSTLQTSVRTYNNVKSIRRRLRAATGLGPGVVVTVEVYSQFLDALIDEQLQFEELRRLSPSLELPDLTKVFGGMETYLGLTIEEYETRRSRAAGSQAIPVTELPQLQNLLSQDTFYNEVSTPLTQVVTRLQRALLEPREIPLRTE